MRSRKALYLLALGLVAVAVAACREPIVTVPLKKEPELSARVEFGGRSAWFIFDTGAGAHTLARWFVEAAGLPIDDAIGAGVSARDAVGTTVPIQGVGRQTARLPGGERILLEAAIVADFPPDFQESEIGGLINPQLLARDDRAVVIDLRVPELRFEPFDRAVRRLGARRLPDDQVQICREQAAPVPNLLYGVRVGAENQHAWLQLDTGAGRTAILSDSPLVKGRPLEPGGTRMGIAGEALGYELARGLPVLFAGTSATIDAHVVETTHGGSCGSSGLLGRDVLDRCALVLGPTSVAAACQ